MSRLAGICCVGAALGALLGALFWFQLLRGELDNGGNPVVGALPRGIWEGLLVGILLLGGGLAGTAAWKLLSAKTAVDQAGAKRFTRRALSMPLVIVSVLLVMAGPLTEGTGLLHQIIVLVIAGTFAVYSLPALATALLLKWVRQKPTGAVAAAN